MLYAIVLELDKNWSNAGRRGPMDRTIARHARGSWFGPSLTRVDSEDPLCLSDIKHAGNSASTLALKHMGGVNPSLNQKAPVAPQ